jgi:hypothetical protein
MHISSGWLTQNTVITMPGVLKFRISIMLCPFSIPRETGTVIWPGRGGCGGAGWHCQAVVGNAVLITEYQNTHMSSAEFELVRVKNLKQVSNDSA